MCGKMRGALVTKLGLRENVASSNPCQIFMGRAQVGLNVDRTGDSVKRSLDRLFSTSVTPV